MKKFPRSALLAQLIGVTLATIFATLFGCSSGGGSGNDSSPPITPDIAPAPGAIDKSFNGTGRVYTEFSSGVGASGYAAAVVVQPDGKFIVAGGAGGETSYGFALARYNFDGSLDVTFNGIGKVGTDFGEKSGAYVLAIDLDGTIVAAGSVFGLNSYAVSRYLSDGSLDLTFNGTGKVTTKFSYTLSSISAARGVAIQSDGKIVAVGDSGVVRYNKDGSLDSTFNETGQIFDAASAVAIQSDGKIITAGSMVVAKDGATVTNISFVVTRYHADGTLDTTFNGTGKAVTSIGTYTIAGITPIIATSSYANALAIQSDGKIVVAGEARQDTATYAALARYNIDGVLDTTFNNGAGTVMSNVGYYNSARSIAIQSDGKLVISGRGNEMPDGSCLYRFNSNGMLDSTFNQQDTGLFESPSTQGARGVDLQIDGKILTVGGGSFGTSGFVIKRYLP